MTPSAADFVSPLVLETLSRNNVLVDLASKNTWANHVMLGRWADLLLVAPASCNSIAKMASGICDNLFLATYLSATCPVWIAPAMDEDMWKHPTTKQNLAKLQGFGNKIIQVGHGELASGLIGEGRMAEPEEMLQLLHEYFKQGPLHKVSAIVTAGPTYEPIDPVRFIGNHSSGKMGVALATSLTKAGAKTTLILGPSAVEVPAEVGVIRVQTAEEMREACARLFPTTDIAIMAAAVADYKPSRVEDQKIKKSESGLTIELSPNPDILKYCGSIKTEEQLLVGFALETNNEEENAKAKLASKNADMIILNSLRDEHAGFGTNTNKVTIFEKSGRQHSLPLQDKSAIAQQITGIITERWYELKKKN